MITIDDLRDVAAAKFAEDPLVKPIIAALRLVQAVRFQSTRSAEVNLMLELFERDLFDASKAQGPQQRVF
jgi:hypothetical protein